MSKSQPGETPLYNFTRLPDSWTASGDVHNYDPEIDDQPQELEEHTGIESHFNEAGEELFGPFLKEDPAEGSSESSESESTPEN